MPMLYLNLCYNKVLVKIKAMFEVFQKMLKKWYHWSIFFVNQDFSSYLVILHISQHMRFWYLSHCPFTERSSSDGGALDWGWRVAR